MAMDWTKYKRPDMARVQAKISKVANQWLDKQTEITGVPKSILIYLAIEQFIQQKAVIDAMSQIAQKVEGIENMPEEVSQRP